MRRKVSGKIVFQATNNHGKAKGKPPRVNTSDPNTYCAYFENEYREQFIFVYDYQAHSGTLWISKKGWEHPIAVIEGKATNAGLEKFEKTWLKGCWNVATTVEKRREYHQKLIEESQQPLKPTVPISPAREEYSASMERLYQGLTQAGIAPNCTRQEFVSGWTGLFDLVTRLEEKYKDKLEATETKSSQQRK